MKEQMNQGVSRSECERIIDKQKQLAATTDLEQRLASYCLALLDECENLRKDKERLEKRVDALESEMNPQDVCDVDARLRRDAAISENAANAPSGGVVKESLTTEIGRAESTARYEAGDLPLASRGHE